MSAYPSESVALLFAMTRRYCRRPVQRRAYPQLRGVHRTSRDPSFGARDSPVRLREHRLGVGLP